MIKTKRVQNRGHSEQQGGDAVMLEVGLEPGFERIEKKGKGRRDYDLEEKSELDNEAVRKKKWKQECRWHQGEKRWV